MDIALEQPHVINAQPLSLLVGTSEPELKGTLLCYDALRREDLGVALWWHSMNTRLVIGAIRQARMYLL